MEKFQDRGVWIRIRFFSWIRVRIHQAFSYTFHSISATQSVSVGKSFFVVKLKPTPSFIWRVKPRNLFWRHFDCPARGAAESVDALDKLRQTRDKLNAIVDENDQLKIQVNYLF